MIALELSRSIFYVTWRCQPWLRRLYLATSFLSVQRKLVVQGMTLERVWEALREDEWESKGELQAASGVDADTLTRMINFLARWDCIEIRNGSELQARRKSNVVPPLETFQLLCSITRQPTTPARAHVIAERVACYKCGGQQLRLVGRNEVECRLCSKRQWRVIEPATLSSNTLLNSGR